MISFLSTCLRWEFSWERRPRLRRGDAGATHQASASAAGATPRTRSPWATPGAFETLHISFFFKIYLKIYLFLLWSYIYLYNIKIFFKYTCNYVERGEDPWGLVMWHGLRRNPGHPLPGPQKENLNEKKRNPSNVHPIFIRSFDFSGFI